MADKTIIPLTTDEVAAYSTQMALILRSGMSAMEGASIMLEDASSESEKLLLTSIYKDLMEGKYYHEAICETKAFPKYYEAMCKIGEESGKLDEVTQALADYYDKEATLASTIKNAVTYPLIMIIMMLIVIVILITKVIPIFNQVFTQLGSEMTGFAGGLVKLGNFMSRYSILLYIIVGVIVVFIVFLLKSKQGKDICKKLISRSERTKALSEKTAAFRFASGMALTLASGLPQDESLKLTAELIENEEYKERLNKSIAEIENGGDFCNTLLENKVFTGVYARMASIADRTGAMDEVMVTISDQYENEIDDKLATVISTIEPTLVIVLSVIVGAILLSVMVPLIGIMSTL